MKFLKKKKIGFFFNIGEKPSKFHLGRMVGSESPCRAELPSAALHSLFFSNSSSVKIFHK